MVCGKRQSFYGILPFARCCGPHDTMNGSEKDRDDGARHASRPLSESELFCRGSDPEGGETIEDPDGITNEYFGMFLNRIRCYSRMILK